MDLTRPYLCISIWSLDLFEAAQWQQSWHFLQLMRAQQVVGNVYSYAKAMAKQPWPHVLELLAWMATDRAPRLHLQLLYSL